MRLQSGQIQSERGQGYTRSNGPGHGQKSPPADFHTLSLFMCLFNDPWINSMTVWPILAELLSLFSPPDKLTERIVLKKTTRRISSSIETETDST
jgi:hypothetical protein